MNPIAALKAWISAFLEPKPSPVFPPDTALLTRAGFKPRGFVHGIELLNDDQTPMGLVVEVLVEHLAMSQKQASAIMLDIHFRGGALIPLATAQAAQQAADAISVFVKQQGYPLVCRAVTAADVAVDL